MRKLCPAGRKTVCAQNIRRDIRIRSQAEPTRPANWHRCPYSLEQLAHRLAAPFIEKVTAGESGRHFGALESLPVAGAALLAIERLASLRLFVRIHAAPYRSCGSGLSYRT